MVFRHAPIPRKGSGKQQQQQQQQVFTQRWFGRTGSIEWPPCSPDLTPMEFFFWGVVKNKEYVKNKEKNPKTVNELKDCIYDAFREIDAN